MSCSVVQCPRRLWTKASVQQIRPPFSQTHEHRMRDSHKQSKAQRMHRSSAEAQGNWFVKRPLGIIHKLLVKYRERLLYSIQQVKIQVVPSSRSFALASSTCLKKNKNKT